jgi:hypothetical protein
MPDIRFATTDVAAMRLGTTPITKVMSGVTEVWPGTPAGTDVLLEPFNNYTAAPWTVVSTPAITAAGRTGNAALFDSASDTATFTIPAPSRSEWLTVGFAWQAAALDTTQSVILELYADAGATRHNRLILGGSATANIFFTRDATSVASSANSQITAAGTWNYLELKSRLHDTAGACIVRLNGVEIINATGLDTRNGGTNTVYESVRLLRSGTGKNSLYDDLYISTGIGAAFKGAITVP